LKLYCDWSLFSTIITFFPLGVRNAAVCKVFVTVLAIRTEPAGMNFEA
jgi:hypothetical protein